MKKKITIDEQLRKLVHKAYEEKRGNKTHGKFCKEIGVNPSVMCKIRTGKQNSIDVDYIKKIIKNTSYQNDKVILQYLKESSRALLRMNGFSMMLISLDNLLLSLDNPRVEGSDLLRRRSLEEIRKDQEKTMQTLKLNSKNIALADNMRDDGYLVGQYPYVVLIEDGYYLVYEANRRICILKALYREFLDQEDEKLKELFDTFDKDDLGRPMIYAFVIDGEYKDIEVRKKIARQVTDIHATESRSEWRLSSRATALITRIRIGKIPMHSLSLNNKILVFIADELQMLREVLDKQKNSEDDKEQNICKCNISDYFDSDQVESLIQNDNDIDVIYSDYKFEFIGGEDRFSLFQEATGQNYIKEWLEFDVKKWANYYSNKIEGNISEHNDYINKNNFFRLCLWSGIVKCSYKCNGSGFDDAEHDYCRKRIINDVKELRIIRKICSKNIINDVEKKLMFFIDKYFWYNNEEGILSLSNIAVLREYLDKTDKKDLKKILNELEQGAETLIDLDSITIGDINRIGKEQINVKIEKIKEMLDQFLDQAIK